MNIVGTFEVSTSGIFKFANHHLLLLVHVFEVLSIMKSQNKSRKLILNKFLQVQLYLQFAVMDKTGVEVLFSVLCFSLSYFYQKTAYLRDREQPGILKSYLQGLFCTCMLYRQLEG